MRSWQRRTLGCEASGRDVPGSMFLPAGVDPPPPLSEDSGLPALALSLRAVRPDVPGPSKNAYLGIVDIVHTFYCVEMRSDRACPFRIIIR